MGIRLDSGDLAYLSTSVRKIFDIVSTKAMGHEWLDKLDIVASNDINESVLHGLQKQEHSITSYGIGTNLVTCQSHPALGCVYKLVEMNGSPRIKLSQDIEKVSLPGKKVAYRLYGKDEKMILDVICNSTEKAPSVGEKFLCLHPTDERKRCVVIPSKVESLIVPCWDGTSMRKSKISEARDLVKNQMTKMRLDHLRSINPTPYKIAVSEEVWVMLHKLWVEEGTVAELS